MNYQRATKRRIRRERFRRRHGNVGFWALVALAPLLIASFYFNHYVLTRGEVTVTVDRFYVTRSDNTTRYSMSTEDGRRYFLAGRKSVALNRSLVPGRRYRCQKRGIAKQLPYFWDLHSEITDCTS